MARDFAAERAAHLDRVRRALRRHRGDCVASHESAAVAMRLPTFAVPGRVWLTRADGPRRNGKTHVSVAELLPEDVAVVDGMAVTAMARTVVDIARSRPFLEALVVADAALRAGVTRQELQWLLVRMWNWPGIRSARLVARWADGRAESPLESVVRGRCIVLDLPVPDLQVWMHTPEGWARVDFWWKQHNVVGEADGRVKYVGPDGADVLWSEKQRRDGLEDERHVVRFRWAQALAPDEVFRARLLAAFERGERLRTLVAGGEDTPRAMAGGGLPDS